MHVRIALLATILLATPATAPAAPPPPRAPELALETYTLPNGLQVALHRDPSMPRVTVCVAYHVGSKDEKAGRTGFAHFFEHMMFRGTKNVPNYDVPLHEAGAESNAFTTEDMTVYHETVAPEYLERALYLEAERLAFLPAALDRLKFDTEREVVKNERRQSYENQPYGLDEETLLARVYPKGHPYSWSVIGSMADLNRATLDDLARFFAEFYHPGNAALVLAGDFDPAEARALIDRYFRPLAAGPKPTRVVAPPPGPKVGKVVRYDAVQLPRVTWTWPTVADGHPDAPALDVLALVLSGGDASRLHRALVLEKRLSKDVDSSSFTLEAAGRFEIQSTAASGAQPSKALAAIEEALNQALTDLRTHPPTAAERDRALALYEMGSYADLTSPLGRARRIAADLARLGNAAYYREDFQRHVAVTLDDLARVSAKYLVADRVALWTVPLEPGRTKTPAEPVGPSPGSATTVASTPRAPAAGPDWSKLPGPSTPRAFRAPRFVRQRLGNGLDVWVAPWTTLPLVDVRLLVPAGTADDPEGKSGLAALAAALFDKGTTRLTATELAEVLEALGASLGATGSADEFATGFETVSRNLDPALKLLGEVLTAPRFDPQDFDRERSLQLARLTQGPDSVNWIARRAFPVLLHGADHPYGNPGDGFLRTVERLTLDDVRAFHGRHVGPKGATLVVVGDVDPAAVFRSVEASLGGWKPQSADPAKRPPARVENAPGVVHIVDKPDAVQSVIAVGRRWVDRSDPRYLPNLLGNRILGGDFLSRLNQNLREKNGYSYGAGSLFRFKRSGSVWQISTQVRGDVTAEALREALGELDALTGARPFTDEEVATAVDAEARSYPESFGEPSSIAGMLAEMARFHLPPDELETFLSRLEATSAKAVRESMAEVVAPKERVVLVVGDRKTVEPRLRALGFQQIRPVTPDGLPIEAAKR